jgi:thiol:disulfide interchange protein
MESTVLVDSEVQTEVSRFVSLKLYTDGNPAERAERNQKLQKETFNSVALPFFALYDSNGQLAKTFQGTAGKQQFLELLRGVK